MQETLPRQMQFAAEQDSGLRAHLHLTARSGKPLTRLAFAIGLTMFRLTGYGKPRCPVWRHGHDTYNCLYIFL